MRVIELESDVADQPWSGKRIAWVSALVLVVVGATRFVGLGDLPLWGDEVYSYIASADLPSKLLLWETKENQLHSPLHFIEIKVARQLLGDTALAVRLPSAVYATLAITLLYAWLAWRVGGIAALFAAAFLTVNPFFLEWSREGRMYSGLLFWTVLTAIAADDAVRRVRDQRGRWFDWPWWALGLLFMFCHASAIWGVMSIAGIGLWLGLMGLAALVADRRGAMQVLCGAALSTFVYLCSWGLAGIGKAMMFAGHAPGEHVDPWASLPAALDGSFGELAGMTPTVATAAIMLVVVVGWLLVMRRRWPVGALVLLLAAAPWAMYPGVIQRHFWAGRYVYIAGVLLAVGFGMCMAVLWRTWPTRVVGLVIVAALIALWAPAIQRVWTQPKMQVNAALAPLREHGGAGDALIVLPHFYVSLLAFPGYAPDERVVLMTPPSALSGGMKLDRGGGRFREPYEASFAAHYVDRTAELPGATWLLAITMDAEGLAALQPMLEAYGLSLEHLHAAFPVGRQTVTLRVSAAGIEHVVGTDGRRHTRAWPYLGAEQSAVE